MSIFTEVGKIITEEAKSEVKEAITKHKPEQHTEQLIEDMNPPPIEGEVVMDGEDMLRVVVINRVVSQRPASSDTPQEPVPSAVEQNPAEEEQVDLSFWQTPIEPETNNMSVQAKCSTVTSENFEAPQIKGNIIFPEDATVSGTIVGNVTAKGILTLYGTIIGTVETNALILCGTIEGALTCKTLTLLPINGSEMSCIKGSVHTEALYFENSKK